MTFLLIEKNELNEEKNFIMVTKFSYGKDEYLIVYDKKAILKNFRNHEFIELKFEKPFVYIHGINGSGKTSVLESIYFCATTKSHRTADEKELITTK
jgi:predicted ATPase